MSTLRSSIVICTRNRSADVIRCLASVAAQSRPPESVIVVDSGTDDASRVVDDFRATFRGEVTYLRTEAGLTLQRNEGIRACNADVVHFLDDDTMLDREYVREIMQTFEGSDGIVGVAPRIREPRNKGPSALSTLYRKLFRLARQDGDGRMLPSGFGSYTWYSGHTEPHEVEILPGCASYRRRLFDRIAFDEYFQGYGYMEDVDFSFRATRLGRGVCNPAAVLDHLHSAGSRTAWRKLCRMQVVNHYYVFKKNLPGTLRHWFWFWWSDFGVCLGRVLTSIRRLQPGIIIGLVEGHLTVLRGIALPKADTPFGLPTRDE